MKKSNQVGYLGPEGTFSHEAVLKIAEDESMIKPYPTILNIFEALECNQITKAVVPIENSTEGSVSITLDSLTYFNVKINRELQLPIKHNLLAQKGCTIKDIKLICSHQQPIAQCRHYINKTHIPVQTMPSTANAARYVTELSNAAVIGNKILSQIYDLEILDENIQDYTNNITRFVILSHNDQKKPAGNDKTSLILSLKDDKPGELHEILHIFAKKEINLTKIESRPSKKGIGKYIFFIDIQGHRLDENISEALNEVKRKVKTLKILGSYQTITS